MLALSHGQAALWFLSRMAPDSAVYSLVAAARVVLPARNSSRQAYAIHGGGTPALLLPEDGAHLDMAALRRTFEELAARHPELRATFAATPAGTPVKRIHERLDPEVLEVDATGWSAGQVEERLAAEAGRPFDLERGPLLRAVAITGAGAPRLLIAVHHIAADFWSLAVIARELGRIYDRETAGPEGAPGLLESPRASYDEHVRRERERLAGPRGERLWAYWSERLREVPDLDLPADRPRPARPFHRGGAVALRLGAPEAGRLRELARRGGATLFATLLAGFEALLARTAGQEDFAVGVPAAGRSSAETAGTVGYFVQPLPLRADLAGDPSALTLLARARRTVREGLAHQALPFPLVAERLRPVRTPGKPPLFQAMLVFHQARRPGEEAFPAFVLGRPGVVLALGERLALDPLPLPPREVPLDVTLAFAEETDGGLAAVLTYSADLFDGATARRMVERSTHLLAAMAAEPGRSVAELPWTGEAELHQVLCEWNDTGSPAAAPGAAARPAGLYERFAAQAARTPGAVALIHGEERVTYGELDRRARELARRLGARGVGPERVVGVSLPRGPDMVAALLAVLAAGGAYLPLDPALPRERRELMEEDARAVLTLTGEVLRRWRTAPAGAAGPTPASGQNGAHGTATGSARKGGQAGAQGAAAGSAPANGQNGAHGSACPRDFPPARLAYVIFTSGSTGRPKGVAVTQASASALLDWAAAAFPAEDLAGTFAATSIGFDISVFEIFAPLAAGGTVVLGENVLALPRLPAAREVTLINTVPSAMAELLRLAPLPTSVRTVCLAGEPLPAELVERVSAAAPGARIWNLYGPTEDTVYSTGAAADGGGPPPIGRPLPGSRAYVLDSGLRPVPLGVPGELALAGAGLARGYLHRPDLTAERFLPDPFATAGAPGARLYRTGDRARLRPGGDLELLGRLDGQVKVRGVRIELGEVEAALLGQPAIREAAAGVREAGAGRGGGRVLVAWVVLDPPDAGFAGLRSALAASLPSAMVPSLWVALPALPRLPSGKVDRRALPLPAPGGAGRAHTPPRDAVEEALAAIWREVLAVEAVGVEESFFDLGGHSLLAMRLLARIHRVLGVELPVRTLFERPTIALLARAVVAEPPRPVPPLVPVPRDPACHLPLSYAQERLWFLDRLAPGSAVYTMPGAFRLRGTGSRVSRGRLPQSGIFPHRSIPRPLPASPTGEEPPPSFSRRTEDDGDLEGASYLLPADGGGPSPALRPEALAAALGELVRRHEVLRTRFVQAAGGPVLAIDPPAPPGDQVLPLIDLGGLPAERREAEAGRLAGEEARRPFDLERGPVLRSALVRLAPEDHLLLVTAHHIAADGWSMGRMAHEVAELAAAALAGRPAALPELPVQYADFASWQRGWLSEEVLAVQLAAWRELLAGAPVRIELPADRPHPEAVSFAGGRVPLALPPDLAEPLHVLARGREASPFMVLAAALAALLGRLSGSEDLLLGTPVANRRQVETEPLIGLFVNTLVLRGDLAGDPPFAALLARVRETALAAYLHQDLPFEKLVEELAPERSLGRSPLVQVLLVLQDAAPARLALPGLEVQPLAVDTGTSKLDLTLELAGDLAGGAVEFRRDLFDEATAGRLAASFVALLDAAVAAPQRPLSELPLLAPAERRQVRTPERVVPRSPRPPRAHPGGAAGGAPRTPTQEILAGLWAELLDRSGAGPRFGPDDDFFDWGGHSLLATLLVSRLREVLGIEIPVREVFAAPTLAGLAERVDAALGRPEPALPPVEPVPRDGPLPLSFAQQRLWLLDRLDPGGSAYNLPLAVRLAGPLDGAALERALAAVIGRHESLRTRFVEAGGEPAQEVMLPGDLAESPVLPRIDLSALPPGVRERELERRLAGEAARPFDLAAGAPIRARLLGLGGGEAVLALTLHHIAADGWSIGVLARELEALCAGEALPPLPVQPADFAVWQRRWLKGEVLERQLGWWRQRLAGVPALELPADRPHPPVLGERGRQVPLALAAGLWERSGAAARRLGATPFMALAAALQALLARWSGQTDFALGFPVANRRRPEVGGLIGLFANTLVLRGDLTGDPTAAELLARTRDAALGAYAHQDLPFEKLVEELRPERDLGRSPLFQVLLALAPPLPAPRLPGVAAEPLAVHTGTAKFELSWLWREDGAGLAGALEHSADLFDAATARRMAGQLERLLAGLAGSWSTEPERRAMDLPLLSEAERAEVEREWNDTGEVPAATLPALIARQVARTPDAVALIAGGERLTYRELDRRAGRLAGRLSALGAGPGRRVAVCLERSAALPAALLAVWKAGGAYVPLDPAWPRERLAWMLEDAGAAVLVGRRERSAGLAGPALQVVDPAAEPSAEPFAPAGSAPAAGPHLPESLAYVIYTSGSTGRPKGVAITHGSAAALALWAQEAFSPAEMAGVLAATSVCFDLSVFELFVPLTLGGTVILAEDVLALSTLTAEVTLVNTVPSALDELVRAGGLPASVGTVCLAGEVLRRDLVDRLPAGPGRRVLNLYGPSEDTTYSTFAVVAPEERGAPAIGRPVAGTRVSLLDPALRPVPPGAAGEICLGGVGLARGYLGRPELTAERFVPDPGAAGTRGGAGGGRLYRTGDLARTRADGSLEFLGRIDDQVKVRGFRIEPGEIEAALAGHPAVREAAVVVRQSDGGERLLAAWVVREPGTGATGADHLQEELRGWLLARLPRPLVPGLFAFADALPRTPSGKTDRLALARRPLPGRLGAASSRLARTPLEATVAAVWCETLDVQDVGLDDDFFALGGHSLLAARLASRLGAALGVELPLRAVFEAPSVERLARRIDTARRAAAPPPLAALPRLPRQGDPPLSFAQERLWFLDRLEGGAALHLAAGVRLAGDLHVAALAAALAEVERRHEVLRTAFPAEDGRPRQVIAIPRARRLPLVDLGGLPPAARGLELERLRQASALAPFDLAAGPPWRALLVRVESRAHELLLAFHHIAVDGWSLGLFTREVAALYAGLAAGAPAPLAPPPIQYADFALWQRGRAAEADLSAELSFWRERLAGDLPSEPLAPDRPRTATRRRRAAMVLRAVPPAVAARLRSLGRDEGASLYMVLLAALGVLLARHGGSREAVMGSPVAGRTRPETEAAMGCFLNTLVLRLDLGPRTPDPTFRVLLGRARETVLAALAHQELPFERVVAELAPGRDASRTPLFQVLLNMLNFPRVAARLPGMDLELSPGPVPPPRFDLTVYAEEEGDAVGLRWVWDAELFEPVRREEIADQLGVLLEQVAADPDVAVDALSLLTPRAARLLPDPTAALPAAWHGSLMERFEQEARRRPDAVAVVDRERAWTYGELLRGSRRLARALAECGVGPGDVVAIHAHRGAALVRAVLGAVAAGAVFLLLDRDDPPSRLAAMVRAARPRAWLETLPGEPPAGPAGRGAAPVLLRLDVSAGQSLAAWPEAAPGAGPDPDAPAYLAFTSGSTGAPKGIVGSQRPLSHFLGWHAGTFGLAAADRFSLLSGLGHDPLLRDLFTPLCLGATLAIPDPERLTAPGWLAGWMAREGITVAHLTPAMAQLLTGTAGEARLPSLRRTFFGGDTLLRHEAARLRALAPEAAAVNFYGATETPQAMGWHAVDPEAPDDGRPVPLGRGIAGVQLLVLTPAGRPAGLGEAGEIWVRTPYLALGYLGDEAATGERFRPNPFVLAPAPHDRLYRMGDLGAYLPDGEVRSLGRADRQIKIRGFRVEPAEIEAALAREEAVREALAMLRGERLIAYAVAADPARPPASAALRAALRRALPPYMVPAAVVVLSALPLTPNGKVDRAALPDPGREEAAGFVAPRDPIEALLAEIWAGVLGVARVGAEDDFFALGGHSLLATQVASRVREACGVELPLRALFEAPTLGALARRIEGTRRGGEPAAPPIRRIPRDGELPLSFAQQRLWFLDQMEPGSPNLHLATALTLSGRLDVRALASALLQAVRRHETLRTTFGARRGRPWQAIAPASALPPALLPPLPVADLGGLPRQHRERELAAQLAALARQPFDLSRGPLVRAVLLGLGTGEHALLLCLHHIVSDGWSTGVLCEELAVLYEACRDGRPSPLPALPVQYVDFASWQRGWLHGEVLDRRLASWRESLGTGTPPVLELPTDRPRPAVPGWRGARRRVAVPGDLASALRELGRRRGATLFMVLMAAFQVLLHRWSGQDELWVGTPVANRTRVELERLIGMFFNLLALRSRAADAPPFSELLARVREAALAAYLHQDLPFEKLLEELQPERHLSRTPLVQVTFVLQNAPRAAIDLPGLALAPLPIERGSANFDLNLELTETPDGLAGWLEYRADLFDAATAERAAAHLGRLLAAAAADPGERISRLPLLSPAERFQLVTAWNDTRAPFPAEATLHGQFAAQAARTPDAPAIVAAGRTLSYRELDERSARLARRLRALGVGPGVPVAVRLERGAEMALALLAVLRAGGYYVPLEPAWPEARAAAILSSLSVAHLLTGPAGRESFLPLAAARPQGLGLWTLAELEAAGEAPGGDGWAADPEALAYVIFTSGSTGVPKGVMVQHRPVVNLIHWVNTRFDVGPGDRLLFVTSLAFDLSVYDLFGILAAGGTVRVAGDDEVRDPQALARILRREPITFWDSAPAALLQVMPFLTPAAGAPGEDRGRLRLAFLSGDWVPLPLPGALREAFPGVEVVALGGATEAAIWSNSFRVGEPAPHWVSVPYGRPIANARYHVLDAGLEPCPAGVPGELYIGGDCLSCGYAGDPELTAGKYLPDPWGGYGARRDLGGERLYRTGDRARWLADGNLEILGRLDHQVKVRGFRVELGEVEAALLAHPAVLAAVVNAREEDGPRGDRRLVAYVVPDPDFAGRAAGAVEAAGAGDAPEAQVARWQVVYDEVYSRAAAEPADPTLNLAGWVSSYTGEPLPEAQMRAWVEATVERILAQSGERGLGRVLEIGCGTGMLLFRIAPRCRRYEATDLSEVSLHYVRRQLAARGLAGLALARRAADDWEGVAPGSFDAVILNSVTQHFPGIAYLRRVLEGAVRAVAPGGFVFVGDVRSLPLLGAFHASVQLAQAPGGLGRAQLARRARQRTLQEEELLVDPRFFTALGASLPAVERVELQLKRGRDANEMSRFRFDAVLRLGGAGSSPAPAAPWREWRGEGFSLPGLAGILAAGRPPALGVSGVPDDRLRAEAALLGWLAAEDGPPTAGALRQALAELPASGVEPEDLWELGRRLGYEAEVRPAAEPGRCDVMFRRAGAPAAVWSKEGPAEGPTGESAAEPSWAGWANDPLQGAAARKLVPRLRAWLAERLPEPMLPSAIVLLDALPLTPNGKVDRRALPPPDGARPDLDEELVAPQSATERQLAAIWCEVLGVESVGVRDNFFALGGDSILSIQVVARAQQAGLRLSPRQIFQHQTLAELAAAAGSAAEPAEAGAGGPAGEEGPVAGPVPLTPIQRWFFEQELEDPHHWNLAVMLEMLAPVQPGRLHAVAARLLEHHDALRLRFRRDGAGWTQHNEPPGAPVPCSTLDLSSLPAPRRTAALEAAAAALQQSLDLAAGPLQRFALFRCGTREPDRLLLTCHHLAIDGVSWRILLEDLQAGLRQAARGEEVRLPPKTTSYRRWAELLAAGARAAELPGEVPYWLDSPRRRPSPLPGDGLAGANLEGTSRRVKVALDGEETRALLRDVPAAFSTRIDDLLLTALARAFRRWTGGRSLLVDLEGNGRGEPPPGVELTRTVGWFTAIYPVLLEVAGGEPEADLLAVKEQLRRVPAGGTGYGLLRYGADPARRETAERLRRLPQAEVIFNDLGQFDAVAGEGALIRPARESFGATRSPGARRRHLLEIYATVLAGRLEVDFEYSAAVHRAATIERLAAWFAGELRGLIDRCRRAGAAGARTFTPSDFPEADLAQEDLDLLLEQLG